MMLLLTGKNGQKYGPILHVLFFVLCMKTQTTVGQPRRISRVLTIDLNPDYKRHRIPLGIFQSMVSRPNVMLQFDGGPADGIMLQPSVSKVTLQGPRKINKQISLQTSGNGEIILDILPDASVRVREPTTRPKVPSFSATVRPTLNTNQNVNRKQTTATRMNVFPTVKSNQDRGDQSRPSLTQTQKVKSNIPEVKDVRANKLPKIDTNNANSMSKNNRKNLAALLENNSKHALLKHRERHIDSQNHFTNGLPDIHSIRRPDAVNDGNFDPSGLFLLSPTRGEPGPLFPHEMLQLVDPDAEPTMMVDPNNPFLNLHTNQRLGDGGITLPDHLRDNLPPIHPLHHEHHERSENNQNNIQSSLIQRLIENIEGLHDGPGLPNDAVIDNPVPSENSRFATPEQKPQLEIRKTENRRIMFGDGKHNFLIQQVSNHRNQRQPPPSNRPDISSKGINNVLTSITKLEHPPPIFVPDNSNSGKNLQTTQHTAIDIRENVNHEIYKPVTPFDIVYQPSHNPSFRTQNEFDLGIPERTTQRKSQDGMSNVRHFNNPDNRKDHLPENVVEPSNRPPHTHFMKDVVDPRSLEGIFQQHFMGEADNPLFLNNRPTQVMLTRTGLFDITDSDNINRNSQQGIIRPNVKTYFKTPKDGKSQEIVKETSHAEISNGFQTSNLVSQTSLPTIIPVSLSPSKNRGAMVSQSSRPNEITESNSRINPAIYVNQKEAKRKVHSDLRQAQGIEKQGNTKNRNTGIDATTNEINLRRTSQTLTGKKTLLRNVDNPTKSESFGGKQQSQKQSKPVQFKSRSDAKSSKTTKSNLSNISKDDKMLNKKVAETFGKMSRQDKTDKSRTISQEEIKTNKDVKTSTKDVVDTSRKISKIEIKSRNLDMTPAPVKEETSKVAKEEPKTKSEKSDKKKSSSKSKRKSKKSRRKRKKSKSKKSKSSSTKEKSESKP